MFQTIRTWHKPQELMREVEFIVVSRPGYRISSQRAQGDAGGRIHWIADVAENVASSDIRQALASGRGVRKLLDEAVVEYIRKEHLYEGSRRKSYSARGA
jgi:nicotinate-nucleotide adenylyltransferase